MKVIGEFEYKGWMCRDAQSFFYDNLIEEQRDGLAVMGFFIKLSNGETHLAEKGDLFTKYEDGSIRVESKYRSYEY
jgi:hypothetical protein